MNFIIRNPPCFVRLSICSGYIPNHLGLLFFADVLEYPLGINTAMHISMEIYPFSI